MSEKQEIIYKSIFGNTAKYTYEEALEQARSVFKQINTSNTLDRLNWKFSNYNFTLEEILWNNKTEDLEKVDLETSIKSKEPITNIKNTWKKNYTIEKWAWKELNKLAREQMKLKLLKDITMDLQICEIEWFDKMEYINDLSNLINSFKT